MSFADSLSNARVLKRANETLLEVNERTPFLRQINGLVLVMPQVRYTQFPKMMKKIYFKREVAGGGGGAGTGRERLRLCHHRNRRCCCFSVVVLAVFVLLSSSPSSSSSSFSFCASPSPRLPPPPPPPLTLPPPCCPHLPLLLFPLSSSTFLENSS